MSHPRPPAPPTQQPMTTVETSTWIWSPPSFCKWGKWYRARVSTLHQACHSLPDAPKAFEKGLSILDLHKKHNYSAEGPKHLVLLWWEWPSEVFQ
jgi:hypothetical protein